MNHQRVVIQDKRNWIDTLRPKGTKSGYNGLTYIIENGQMIFGLVVAPKASIIIHSMELGKPVALPYLGSRSAKSNDCAEGRGYGKKRMVARNRLHRGASALIRKDADFPLVFHCMNRDKPMNMRKSITL